MGKNKKENFVFTLMMCALMVFIMSGYNIFLLEGFSKNFLKELLLGFLPGFCVALFLDVFVVGKIAKSLHHKLVDEDDSMIKKIFLMSFFMVCGMVLFMSFYGAFINIGFSPLLFKAYPIAVMNNFIFALPLQLIIVSPIVRTAFVKIYPPVPVNS